MALVTSSNKKLLSYFKFNSNSFFVTTSKAPVTTSVALVTSRNKKLLIYFKFNSNSFLLLLVRHLLLLAWHLLLVVTRSY